MARILLWIVLFALVCQAAVQSLSQDMLKNYLVNGAPFDFILIDIRSSAEIFDLIGNKECQPYNLEWPSQFKEEYKKIPKDFPIIIYCASGARAAGASDYLSVRGYDKVFNAGGFKTWDGPKVPTSRIKPVSLLPAPSMRAKNQSLNLLPSGDAKRTIFAVLHPDKYRITNTEY